MRKFVLMFALLGVLAVTKASAQALDPATDYLYTCVSFNAYLKFDINDQLQNIYFSTGKVWSEYEIVDDNYIEGKGWTYKIKDGLGNIYVVKRPTLEGDLTISPIKAKVVILKRKIYTTDQN
jgi:hypothetical protein